jgi:hypothetical protein
MSAAAASADPPPLLPPVLPLLPPVAAGGELPPVGVFPPDSFPPVLPGCGFGLKSGLKGSTHEAISPMPRTQVMGHRERRQVSLI